MDFKDWIVNGKERFTTPGVPLAPAEKSGKTFSFTRTPRQAAEDAPKPEPQLASEPLSATEPRTEPEPLSAPEPQIVPEAFAAPEEFRPYVRFRRRRVGGRCGQRPLRVSGHYGSENV